MDRQEHLQWCKDRAEEYLQRGDIQSAYASFVSDMNKEPETANHSALGLGVQLMIIGSLNTVAKMREFIQGFN